MRRENQVRESNPHKDAVGSNDNPTDPSAKTASLSLIPIQDYAMMASLIYANIFVFDNFFANWKKCFEVHHLIL